MINYAGSFIENHALVLSQADLLCQTLLTRLKYYTHIAQPCQIVAKRHRTSLFYQ